MRGARKYSSYQAQAKVRGARLWLRRLILGGFVTLMLFGIVLLVYKGLARSEFFQVTEIEIEGNHRVAKEQILELSGVDIHSNLVALSSRQVQGKLASHGWVEKAAVERHWPNRLKIIVSERTPVAILNLEGHLFYLDRKGNAFAQVVPPDDLDFPVISGGKSGEGPGAARPAVEEALQFLRYAAGGNPNLPAQNISEINISSSDELVLFLMSRPFPINLGRGEMKSKYARLTQVLAGLYKRKEFDEIAYIDVDYQDGRILVGMLGG